MQNDETIWRSIGGKSDFCSFKIKAEQEHLCRNPYNVTAVCSRVTCPLANSNYGTVIESEGICYLHLKTAERAHTPLYMWEKIPLSKCYKDALKQIEEKMTNAYKEHQIMRCKQRFTRIRQTLMKMRQLKLQPTRILTTVRQKTDRRQLNREKWAEKAAHLETNIEKELLERLHEKVYGELYAYDNPQSEVAPIVEECEKTKYNTAAEKGYLEFDGDDEVETADVLSTEYGSDCSDDFSDDEGIDGSDPGRSEISDIEDAVVADNYNTANMATRKRQKSATQNTSNRRLRREIEYETETVEPSRLLN